MQNPAVHRNPMRVDTVAVSSRKRKQAGGVLTKSRGANATSLLLAAPSAGDGDTDQPYTESGLIREHSLLEQRLATRNLTSDGPGRQTRDDTCAGSTQLARPTHALTRGLSSSSHHPGPATARQRNSRLERATSSAVP